MKILVTGNKKRGVAKAIYERLPYGHDTKLVSREMHVDLNTEEGRTALCKMSLKYDTFINCSKLECFNQTLLLKEIWDYWIKNNKKGHIINIGSTVDTGLKGGSRLYTTEKVALRNFSRKLSFDTLAGNGIRVTYISFGYLDTEGVSFKYKNKIELEEVVAIIEWVIDSPEYININEISIDPIQEREE